MRARLVGVMLATLCAAVGSAPAGALAGEGCANEALREEQRSTFLPDCRAYEMVSPPEKNGGDIYAMSFRTHAAADGNALAFASLTGFADAMGTGVTVDYLAQRSPGTGGWVTHALTPPVSAGSAPSTRAAGGDTIFEEFSPDLTSGVLESATPVGDAGNVSAVPNLYMRGDVFKSGVGSYALMSGCPVCDASSKPLPPVASDPSILPSYWPRLAGISPDGRHAVFESIYDLTGDAPAQTGFCGDTNGTFPPPAPTFCATRLYEWDEGGLSLVGRVPVPPATECNDSGGGPACIAADMSVAGGSARKERYTPRVVSDGSDGHTRVIFTQPANGEGETYSKMSLFEQFAQGFGRSPVSGNLFMQVDDSQTVQLNVSEATVTDKYAPAEYLDASANGERVFFMSAQALTNDAEPGARQVYMYDTAAAAGHHLTLLTPEGGVAAVIGVSNDGHYVYIDANGKIRLWHDGALTDIAQRPFVGADYLSVDGGWSGSFPSETRVTPDGLHLLYVSDLPPGTGGYDHGKCSSGFGCLELYVYSADSNTVQCASCNPTGAPAATDASLNPTILDNNKPPLGGGLGTSYLNHALSGDGRFVFFNSEEALVPQDTNGKSDAYEYDTHTGRVSLLSSGSEPSGSYFLDADAEGGKVFIATRAQLVSADTDSSYDIYDARSGGGFAEPIAPSACAAVCQGTPLPARSLGVPSSVGFSGAGNLTPSAVASPKPLKRAQRLARALRECRVRHRRRNQRRRCEARARRRYGKASSVRRGK